MPYVIGIVLALSTVLLGRLAGFDRDRAYYPLVLVVTASYYVLFAVMGGSMTALLTELVVMTAFLAAAIVGFKLNVWVVVAALAGHARNGRHHQREGHARVCPFFQQSKSRQQQHDR
jgi:hypothetical protein